MDDEHLAEVGLRFAVEGPVATLTLHRPEAHNAQTPVMWRAMAVIGAAIPDDVRVVVVAGAGPSFSAGLDRTMLDPTGSAECSSELWSKCTTGQRPLSFIAARLSGVPN